jgi:hypothetical protein
MNTALLLAVDAPGMLREIAFGLLLRDRRPVEVADLAAAAGMPLVATQSAVTSLAQGGWLDLDEAGRVTGSAGLSLATGPHTLTLEDAAFRTWCAYDALGIAAALGVDAGIETTCGRCGAAITLSYDDGKPDRRGPEQLWLADGGGDLRGSFCTPTVLLCGDEHGAAWEDAQAGSGQLLDLEEGARLGGEAWAGCAATAKRLARA